MTKKTRNCPIDQLIDLKVDYAFKQLFGTEKNKHITVVFLNAILQRSDAEQIEEIVFIRQEVGGAYAEDKQSRLDVVVRTQSGTIINIEIQLAPHGSMFKRTLYYWSRLYSEQLKAKDAYSELTQTITINICESEMFPWHSLYHTSYHLYCNQNNQRLMKQDDMIEVHFIEIRKFMQKWGAQQIDPNDDLLTKWLLLLSAFNARKKQVDRKILEELEGFAMYDKELQHAINMWEDMSLSEDVRFKYFSRMKYFFDAQSDRKDAIALGESKGLVKGRAEGIVEMCKDIGLSREETLTKLMQRLSLPKEQAEEYMAQYW